MNRQPGSDNHCLPAERPVVLAGAVTVNNRGKVIWRGRKSLSVGQEAYSTLDMPVHADNLLCPKAG